MTAADAAMVDGLLVHAELLPHAAEVCPPEAIASGPHRAAYRALLDGIAAGEVPDPGDPGAGYRLAARHLPAGYAVADLLGLGRVGDRQVDTSDPIAAAHVVAEAHRRRLLAAELAAAAEAVAAGADPDAVLTRVELAR